MSDSTPRTIDSSSLPAPKTSAADVRRRSVGDQPGRYLAGYSYPHEYDDGELAPRVPGHGSDAAAGLARRHRAEAARDSSTRQQDARRRRGRGKAAHAGKDAVGEMELVEGLYLLSQSAEYAGIPPLSRTTR